MYLGKEHKFYQFPNYIKRISVPDVVSVLQTKSSIRWDKNLLSKMISAEENIGSITS
jgi:hypothetical protein